MYLTFFGSNLSETAKLVFAVNTFLFHGHFFHIKSVEYYLRKPKSWTGSRYMGKTSTSSWSWKIASPTKGPAQATCRFVRMIPLAASTTKPDASEDSAADKSC
jgi:hypothetical protein